MNITVEDIEIQGQADISFACKRIDKADFEIATTIRFDMMFKGGIEVMNTMTIKGHLTDIIMQADEVVYSIIGEVNI